MLDVKLDGWRVKPLEWEAHADIEGLHNAKGADGWYYNIFERLDGGFNYEGHPGTFPPPHPTTCDSLHAAKAAAQADYEARILSALEPLRASTPTEGD